MGGCRGRNGRKGRATARGVSPIIATILLVAITVVLAAVLYVLVSGLTRSPNPIPLGSTFALGAPTEWSVGAPPTGSGFNCAATCFAYAFTIQAAGSGLTWNSVDFAVRTPAGVVATVAGYVVWGISGPQSTLNASVAYASGSTESGWSAGTGSGITHVSTTQTLVIYASASSGSNPLGGQTLFALGVGAYSGTVQVLIP